jgi:hypothetical protein
MEAQYENVYQRNGIVGRERWVISFKKETIRELF